MPKAKQSTIGNLLVGTGSSERVNRVPNLITYFFDEDIIKALMYLCLRIDIPDNNDKARIVKDILGPGYDEIGTGTNRTAFFRNGMTVKIALDRRG